MLSFLFFFNDTATTEIYTLSLHDALPICGLAESGMTGKEAAILMHCHVAESDPIALKRVRSEEHTSELQSRLHLVCRLLLEKKKKHQAPERSIKGSASAEQGQAQERFRLV